MIFFSVLIFFYVFLHRQLKERIIMAMSKKKIKVIIDFIVYILTAIGGWLTGSAFATL